MSGLTTQLAQFVAGYRDHRAPDECRSVAQAGFTDCVAVLIAGSQERASQLAGEIVRDVEAGEWAPLIPSGRRCAPADAAFVNGVAAHVLDYDDVGMDGHPSIVFVPAILAAGSVLDSCGRDALDAYVVGYEVWSRLKSCEPGQMHDRGFHPTALWGTVGAAAAVASLHRLNLDQSRNAIGIAASLASGLVANFGTMTKSLHAGRAAQAAIVAVDLARRGFTAAADVIEHSTGYLRAHAVLQEGLTLETDFELGRRWAILETGLNIKRYPVCYSTHRPIDAMLGIVEAHRPNPEDVAEIRVGAGTSELLMLRNHEPKTALEAKFSMEFAMAAALIARSVGLEQLDDAFVHRADVVEAMSKVRSTAIHDGIAGLPDSPPDTVEVVLKSGAVLNHPPVQFPRGSWQNPLEPDEMREKFLGCATRFLVQEKAERLFDILWNLESLASVRDLDAGAA